MLIAALSDIIRAYSCDQCLEIFAQFLATPGHLKELLLHDQMLWVVTALDPLKVVLFLGHQLGLLVGRCLMLDAVLADLLHWEDLGIELIGSGASIDRRLGGGFTESSSRCSTTEGMCAAFQG